VASITPGNQYVISHDIVVENQYAFRYGERIIVETVYPNPQMPSYQYVVYSPLMDKRFQLSDADLMELPQQPYAQAPAAYEARASLLRRIFSSRITKVAIVLLVVAGIAYGGYYYLTWRHNQQIIKALGKVEIVSPKKDSAVEAISMPKSPSAVVELQVSIESKTAPCVITCDGKEIPRVPGKDGVYGVSLVKDGKHEFAVVAGAKPGGPKATAVMFTLKKLPTVEKVVFSRGGNIWIMNLDGSGQRQLTASGMDDNAKMSLDGSKIVFDSRRDRIPYPLIQGGAPFAVGWMEFMPQVYVMDPNGQNQVRLTQSEQGYCSDPSFFPDNQSVVFHREYGWHDEYYYKTSLSVVDIGSHAVKDVATRDEEDPDNSFNTPSVTIDGLAIISSPLGSQAVGCSIERTDLTTGATSTVVPGDSNYGYFKPILSRDSKALSATRGFYLGASGQPDLFVSDQNGNNPKLNPVAAFGTDWFETTWTLDGNLVSSGCGYQEGFGTMAPGTEKNIFLVNAIGQVKSQVAQQGVSVFDGIVQERYTK